MKILVTGGAGFIGNHLVRMLLREGADQVVVLDALTYAGSLSNLSDCMEDSRCVFVHADVTDGQRVTDLLKTYAFDVVYHLAAETHVDRSIASGRDFVHTNIVGTFTLLEAIRTERPSARMVHVSTDEVYGALAVGDLPFTEHSPLRPSSPYAASKAAADMLVHAHVTTYGLDVVVTRCCNNYGPMQYPEKFIPLMVKQALAGQPLPVYGDGQQRREWIHVTDHCKALIAVAGKGKTGDVYNIGTGHEEVNIDVVERIVQLTQASPSLITMVPDRPAHDVRYALDAGKLRSTCGWTPVVEFNAGLADCVTWFVENNERTRVVH